MQEYELDVGAEYEKWLAKLRESRAQRKALKAAKAAAEAGLDVDAGTPGH